MLTRRRPGGHDETPTSTLSASPFPAQRRSPPQPRNARRIVTDAEIVALEPAIIGIHPISSFYKVAAGRLFHLFPGLPAQPGWQRQHQLADTIASLIYVFANQSPVTPTICC